MRSNTAPPAYKIQPLLPGFDLPEDIPRRPLARHRIPTNTTTRQHPIHRWFNFIAGFSPEFVHECCDRAAIGPQDILLDPFAGCGTAPVVACERGIRAIGYDPHPIFSRIARAKLPFRTSLSLLDRIARELKGGFEHPLEPKVLGHSPQKFLSKLFPREVLSSLLGARQALSESKLDQHDLAFLVLSRVVERCSHSQTDGIYKAPTTRKKTLNPFDACDETVKMIDEDLRGFNGENFAESAEIYAKSSERMAEIPDGQVSLIVTSPPYLNNFDFAEMTRMLVYFWGIATSWGEITQKIRQNLILNTTTALKGSKSKQPDHRANTPLALHGALDTLVRELARRRKSKAGKKEYALLVYPYFSQMTNVLRECYRCLKSHGEINIIVGDAALYGVHISTPQFLRDILIELGFHRPQCELVRRRGHRWLLAKREGSSIGLGEYHLRATK
jgi:DNA modification methylase